MCLAATCFMTLRGDDFWFQFSIPSCIFSLVYIETLLSDREITASSPSFPRSTSSFCFVCFFFFLKDNVHLLGAPESSGGRTVD